MSTLTTPSETEAKFEKPVESKIEKKERLAVEAQSAWADHNARKQAVDANTERLRELRLAHEAKLAAEPVPKPKKKRAPRA
jgi:hypothetical protein